MQFSILLFSTPCFQNENLAAIAYLARRIAYTSTAKVVWDTFTQTQGNSKDL